MADPVSPFVPGARVALSSRFRDGYDERFVDRVYKSGRFTLVGGKGQQWRPWHTRDGWYARETGSGWARGSLRPWDDSTDAEISAVIAQASRKERALKLRRRFEQIRPDNFTDAMLDAIEAVLP